MRKAFEKEPFGSEGFRDYFTIKIMNAGRGVPAKHRRCPPGILFGKTGAHVGAPLPKDIQDYKSKLV